MKKTDIKRHLKDYSVYNKRRTTINHAFASALSIADIYDESKVDAALKILGQEPDNDLLCAYCDRPATTWDHIKAVVNKGSFSRHGHTLNNLIPCCKECNSERKRNLDWSVFLQKEKLDTADRVSRIEKYIGQNTCDINQLLETECKSEMAEFEKIKEQIFELMKAADRQAKIIRTKVKENLNRQ
jgi:hypothetical protein